MMIMMMMMIMMGGERQNGMDFYQSIKLFYQTVRTQFTILSAFTVTVSCNDTSTQHSSINWFMIPCQESVVEWLSWRIDEDQTKHGNMDGLIDLNNTFVKSASGRTSPCARAPQMWLSPERKTSKLAPHKLRWEQAHRISSCCPLSKWWGSASSSELIAGHTLHPRSQRIC